MSSEGEMVPASMYRAIRERNEELEERMRQMEEIVPDAPPVRFPKLGLTHQQGVLLWLLFCKKGCCDRTWLQRRICETDPSDLFDPLKVLHVQICKLRSKLAPHGITITTHYGRGYELPEDSRKKLKEMEGL
jgi:DNA-binding response OmpR family regulator